MKDIGRAWSAFIEDKGKFAEAASFKEPDLKWIREQYAGGGAIAERSVPMLLEELKCELTMYNYDPDAIAAFGLAVGSPQAFQFRRELFDTSAQTTSSIVVHTLATVDLEFPDWDRKKLEGVKLPLFVTTYRRFRDGVLELHIDPEGGIIDMGDGNILAETNRAIGRN